MANVPEIRFKGFEDEWEQRKLGDTIKESYNGQTPSRMRPEYWNGDIDWLASGDLNRSIITRTSEKITKEGLESANLRIVPKGTFIMAITGLEAAGTRGNCGILGLDAAVNQSCMAIFPQREVLDTNFLFQWYRRYGEEYGIAYTQGTKQQSYNAELIKVLPIMVPSVIEQKKVAGILWQIDTLIALHQRKCDETKELKKYMLQKMFPKEGEKVPEIRFAGFEGDWEEKKLGDILEITTRTNSDNQYSKEDVLSVSDEFGLINQIEFQGRSFAAEDVSGYKKVEPGDVIYTRSPLALKPYGIIKKSFSERGIISPLYIVNTVRDDNDSTFIYYNFDSPEKTSNYLRPLVRIGAKHTMNISNEEWLSGNITVPSGIEQQQIGSFFKSLDTTITYHQRKCDEAKELKKFMLQNMFPKKG